jgi:mannose-6-phosphate isomerase
MEPLYPLTFEPVYQDYVWGGDRIPRLFGRPTRRRPCAESWEIADRPEGMSVVRAGPLAGRTLRDLHASLGAALGGSRRPAPPFPLLVKILDAERRLSVQVHPDEEAARRDGGEAKTEMWVVLHAEPGASLFAGLRPGVDRRGLAAAVRESRVPDVLREVPVSAGQIVFIPGGRIHALGAGCVVLEVQQNSNTVYRVYDWGQVGNDGKPRPLHTEQALRAVRPRDEAPLTIAPRPAPAAAPNRAFEIHRCPYFHLTRHDLAVGLEANNDGQSFHALFVVSGSLHAEGGGQTAVLGKGDTCLLPAGLEAYRLQPGDDGASVIRIALV